MGFRCSGGLWFWFMITRFMDCLNNMVIEGNGKSRGCKQIHTQRFRHGSR